MNWRQQWGVYLNQGYKLNLFQTPTSTNAEFSLISSPYSQPLNSRSSHMLFPLFRTLSLRLCTQPGLRWNMISQRRPSCPPWGQVPVLLRTPAFPFCINNAVLLAQDRSTNKTSQIHLKIKLQDKMGKIFVTFIKVLISWI